MFGDSTAAADGERKQFVLQQVRQEKKKGAAVVIASKSHVTATDVV